MTNFASKFTETIVDRGGLKGARIFVAPFPSPDVVSIMGSVAGGSRAADQAHVPREVAAVHAAMLMEGTRRRKKAEIQAMLDSMGAELSFNATADRLSFFARVSKKHGSKLLSLIAEMLSEPAFPRSELEVFKKRSLASLALAAEDPRVQSGILLSRAIYPKGHLNYSETTDESRVAMMKISAQDLVKYHKTTINAATLIVVGAGDIESKSFATDVTRAFAKLPRSDFALEIKDLRSDLNTGPTLEAKNKGSEVVPQAPKPSRHTKMIPGKASIDYLIGLRLGITEDHPDYPALLIGLRVLGNAGFTGRLMQQVRERQGLTYGTYAYLAGLDGGADGYAMAYGTFAPELFARGRTAIVGEIERLLHEGAGNDEVQKHAEMFVAKTAVRMSDSSAYARSAHEVIAEGRKLSYLDEFPERVRQVTAPEVNAALKKYLKLGLMSEAAAGPVGEDALK